LPLRIQHARALTQNRCRADTSATLPQDVGFKNGLGRAVQIAGKDLADELRHVDPCRAGLDAWSVMAEEAARSFFQCLSRRERRIDVREILFELVERKFRSWLFEHGHLAGRKHTSF